MKNRSKSILSIVALFVFFEMSFITNLDAKEETADDTSLAKKLSDLAEASKNKTPPEKKIIMNDAIEKLRLTHIAENSLKVGDKIPQFTLLDVKKNPIDSSALLKKGPLVIVFYRGGWCPYCNLQLRDLQGHLKDITSTGAQLVAISPQTPDNSLSTAQKSDLSFFVLSDVGNKVDCGRKAGV